MTCPATGGVSFYLTPMARFFDVYIHGALAEEANGQAAMPDATMNSSAPPSTESTDIKWSIALTANCFAHG